MEVILVILVSTAAMILGSMFAGALLWLAWGLVAEGMFNAPHLDYWVAVVVMLTLSVIGSALRS